MFPGRKAVSINRIESLLEQILAALQPVDTSSLDAVAEKGHGVTEEFQTLTPAKEKEK